MNKPPYDPNSLADELDRVLPPGQAGQSATSNNPLVEAAVRLHAAPRPTLSPEALARIHATVLAAQSTAPAASSSLTRRFLRQSALFRLAAAAMLLFVFVTGALFAARMSVQFLNPPSATALPPTVTALPPTLTATVFSIDTAAPILAPPTVMTIATELPQVLPTTAPASPTPTIPPTTTRPTVGLLTETPATVIATAASPTMTSTPPTTTFTATLAASTPPPTLPVTIIVEGPIQAINGNTIIIFDLTIVLSTSDPLLPTLQIGDVVRVEGGYAGDNQVITAIYVTAVTAVTVEINVNPTDGQVWTDPGNCSNPPPPWAPANGWRRRCQGASGPGNSGGNGMGMGD